MAEPQYASYFDYPHETMGAMASQYFRDDPKLLGIHLARYKHTAKLLAGKKLVAEIGCGDAWFSRVVKQEVGELHLYDFDHRLINDHGRRGGYTFWHDMLVSKLPHTYNAAYSLDCLEHIALDKQDIFLTNICGSLKEDGVFIVGMPSLESQPYASEASKIGHIGCRSGSDLKKLLENHFKNVFLFSMHDETISTAFLPMSHYLMAVCVGVK